MSKFSPTKSILPTEQKEKESQFSTAKKRKRFRDDQLIYMTVAMFFIGNILSVLFAFRTMIPILDLLALFGLVILTSLTLSFFLFYSIFYQDRMERIMVAIFGIGPILMGMLLMLNFLIPFSERSIETNLNKVTYGASKVVFEVDELPCKDYPELCEIYTSDERFRKNSLVTIRITKGLLGYEVLREMELSN